MISFVEVECVDAFARGGEVGVDFEAVEVAYDEEGRVAQVNAVVVELLVSFLEGFVLAFALVFPGEAVAQPDVGEAGSSTGLAYVLFEGVALASGVRLSGCLLAQELAKFVEMGLCVRPLGLRVDFPTMYEVGEGKGHGIKG